MADEAPALELGDAAKVAVSTVAEIYNCDVGTNAHLRTTGIQAAAQRSRRPGVDV